MYRLRLGPILADAQSASLRKIHSSRHIGPFPARPSVLGSPLEGRALHAPNIRIATYRDISPFGHQLLAKSSVIMLCPGLRPALQTDAQGAPLREHRPPRYARVFPARPSCPGWHTPRRGGLRTPVMSAWCPTDVYLIGPPKIRLPFPDNEKPGHVHGLKPRHAEFVPRGEPLLPSWKGLLHLGRARSSRPFLGGSSWPR